MHALKSNTTLTSDKTIAKEKEKISNEINHP